MDFDSAWVVGLESELKESLNGLNATAFQEVKHEGAAPLFAAASTDAAAWPTAAAALLAISLALEKKPSPFPSPLPMVYSLWWR